MREFPRGRELVWVLEMLHTEEREDRECGECGGWTETKETWKLQGIYISADMAYLAMRNSFPTANPRRAGEYGCAYRVTPRPVEGSQDQGLGGDHAVSARFAAFPAECNER